jgi:hypothetical protein
LVGVFVDRLRRKTRPARCIIALLRSRQTSDAPTHDA